MSAITWMRNQYSILINRSPYYLLNVLGDFELFDFPFPPGGQAAISERKTPLRLPYYPPLNNAHASLSPL